MATKAPAGASLTRRRRSKRNFASTFRGLPKAPCSGRELCAVALDQRLAAIASTSRTACARSLRSIPGRVTFSTSLGHRGPGHPARDRASGAPIDVFTLDTGRHFPETLETLEASETALWHRASASWCPMPRGGGARRPRRHLRLPPRGREPQGLLRGAQGAPAEARAGRRRAAGSRDCGASSRRGARDVAFAAWDADARPRQGQPDRRLAAGAARGLHRRANDVPRQPAARAGLPLDRMPAVHARHPARRGHPRRTLVVGERGRQGMRAAQSAARRREQQHDGALLPSRRARGRRRSTSSARRLRSSASRC